MSKPRTQHPWAAAYATIATGAAHAGREVRFGPGYTLRISAPGGFPGSALCLALTPQDKGHSILVAWEDVDPDGAATSRTVWPVENVAVGDLPAFVRGALSVPRECGEPACPMNDRAEARIARDLRRALARGVTP